MIWQMKRKVQCQAVKSVIGMLAKQRSQFFLLNGPQEGTNIEFQVRASK